MTDIYEPIEPKWSGANTLAKEKPLSSPLEGLKAKKDFLIVQNDFRADIKEGDDLGDIPPVYYENLKTEGVI